MSRTGRASQDCGPVAARRSGGPDAQARGRTGHGRADRSGAEGAVGGEPSGAVHAHGARRGASGVAGQAAGGRAAGPRSRHAAAGPTGSRAGIADLAGQGGWQQQRRRIGQDADIGLLVAAERAMLAAFVRIVLRRLAAVVRAHVDLNQARAVGAQYSTDTRCAGCAGLNARASDGPATPTGSRRARSIWRVGSGRRRST